MPDVDFCRGRFQLQDLGQVLAICDAGEIHGEDKNLISRRPIEREAWMMVVQLRQQTRVSWARERANHRKPAGPPPHGCKATRLHGAWDLLILHALLSFLFRCLQRGQALHGCAGQTEKYSRNF
jgi:hypothetical protein